jgi:hypothetical protein
MDEKFLKTPQQYEYFLDDTRYDTEVALHEADSEVCLTGEHDWKKLFTYGKYSCKKCKAIRMKTK